MLHQLTKGPQSGMRSNMSLQGIKQTNSTRSSSSLKGHHSDVHNNKLLQKLRPYKGEEYRDRLSDTFRRKSVQSRQWRFVTYDGAVFFESQRKKTIRQSRTILDIQTASGVVVSDAQAKVYIKERGACLWVHLVKDSPSVLSLGRLCKELGCSYSWPSEETPRLSKGKKVIECSIDNIVPVIAVTKKGSRTIH